MAEDGGENARRGFNFQDYVTADYFLEMEKSSQLHIEKYSSDFALFVRRSERIENHYYQVKSLKQGNFTWNDFKEDVAPTFKGELEKQKESEETPHFYLIANCNPNKSFNDFLEEVRNLRERKINPQIFKNRVGKGKINRLKNKLEVDEGTLMMFLRGFFFDKRFEKGVESSIENYLRSLHPGKFRKAKEEILNEIHETNSGTINRKELEELVGFELKAKNNSTSSNINPAEVQEEVQEIKKKYEKEYNNSISVEQDQHKVNLFTENLETQIDQDDTIKELELDSTKTEINNDFERFKQHKQKTEKFALQITNKIDSLEDLDDSDE